MTTRWHSYYDPAGSWAQRWTTHFAVAYWLASCRPRHLRRPRPGGRAEDPWRWRAEADAAFEFLTKLRRSSLLARPRPAENPSTESERNRWPWRPGAERRPPQVKPSGRQLFGDVRYMNSATYPRVHKVAAAASRGRHRRHDARRGGCLLGRPRGYAGASPLRPQRKRAPGPRYRPGTRDCGPRWGFKGLERSRWSHQAPVRLR